MRISLIVPALLVMLSGGFSQIAIAGERLEYEVVQPQVKERVTVYLQGTQARISSSGNTAAAVIFDANVRQIHILNHAEKSVTTLDQASIEQLASVAKGVGEFAQSQGGVLGDLLQTFGLDNALGEQAQLEIKNLAGSQKVSGLSCQVQQVYKDGALDTQLCLTGKISMSQVERDTLDSLIIFAQLLIREGQVILEQFNLPIPLLPVESLSGVPIYIDNITNKTTATLLGFKTLDIQAAQFSLPATYSRTVLSL